MHATEEYIKSILDGTWTTVDYYGKVITQTVNGHEEQSIVSTGDMPKGRKNAHVSAYWSEHEDELLWSMKVQGRPTNEIAWVIGRTEGATKKRYAVLKVRKTTMMRQHSVGA
jgi:hypothetical protein